MSSSTIRWVYAAGAALACAGIMVSSSVAAHGRETPVAAHGGENPVAVADARPASAPRPPGTLGDVIESGTGGWVFWFTSGKHLGLHAGRPGPDGTLVDVIVTNETEGSDRAPGFHAAEGTMNIDGRDTPTFGYYAGPAARITAQAGGRTVTAGQAAWSVDPAVKVFWFTPGTGVTGLAAFDEAGRKLPAGHAQIAVG